MTSTSSTRTTFALEAPPATPDIVITREFDAPRDRVFAAYVDAEAVSQWWGPRTYETVVDSLDARHGGTWRFTNRKDEDEHSFRGVYHDVVPAQRIVNTFEYEGMPGHVGLVTTTFEDLGGGRSKLTEVSLFPSFEDRDGIVASGMEDGARESLDRLDELLVRS
jgi:uncharacterized protein YndB with AHSA1/START domain